MINRRTWISTTLGSIATFIFTAIASPKSARADVHELDADTLIYTLKVGRDEDKAFIHRVMELVNTGHLPLSLVQKCYWWAIRKQKHKFHYFRYSLIKLAAAKNITVK